MTNGSVHIAPDPPILYRRYIWGRKYHVHNHNLQYKLFYAPPHLSSEGHLVPETPIYYRGNKLYNATKHQDTESSLKISSRISFLPESEDESSTTSSRKNDFYRPKIITIIRAGEKPYTNFKILLNKNNDQKYKDLLSDISEAGGLKKNSNPIKKLIGRNATKARKITDLFNNGDIFIGLGDQDPDLEPEEIERIIAEAFRNDYSGAKNSPRDDYEREPSDSLTVVEEELDDDYLEPEPQKGYPKNWTSSNKRNNPQNYPREKYPNNRNKKDEPHEKTSKKKPKQIKPWMVEEVPTGYPHNDSRKPGAFEMIPEISTEDVIPPKHRAHILGFERERASQEERARARNLMAKKIKKEREEANEDPYKNRGMYYYKKPNRNSNSDPYKEEPYDSDNYKHSPYNENMSLPKYNLLNDKDNMRPYKSNNTYPKYRSFQKIPENDRSYPGNFKYRYPPRKLNGIEYERNYPTDSVYPYSRTKPKNNKRNFNPTNNKDNADENDPNQRGINNNNGPIYPKTTRPRRTDANDFDYLPKYDSDNFNTHKPRKNYKRFPSENIEKDDGSKYPKAVGEKGDHLNENEKPKRESNSKKNVYQPTGGERNQRPYMKPLNQHHNDNGNQRWERIPPINLSNNPRNGMDQNKYRAPSSINIPTLGTVTEEDNDNKKLLNKPIDISPQSAEKRRDTRSLSSLIGPRGDTVKIGDHGKPLQLPTRTHKQSMMVRNPEMQRIVPQLATQLAENDKFNDLFDVGHLIATGNFSEVKEAKKKPGGKSYAVKIIEKEKLKDKEDLIEEEIRILRSCDHPNIMKLEEQYESPLNVFLVTELVKEGDLFDAICDNIKFTESQAAVMMRDLCRALFYLHSRGIAHRDIKPENLLVVKTNGIINLKLADFGLAVEVHDPLFVICGTPTYVAPEILTEQGYGIKVDVWAAGVVAYILLSGFPPFRSPDRKQTELFEFVKAGEFEYLSPYWDNISEDARDLIDHMIVVNPSKRYSIIDVLCHPWILTLGGSLRFNTSIDEVRNQMRVDLQIESISIKSDYEKIK